MEEKKLSVALIINSLSHRGGAEVLFYNLCKEMSTRSNINLAIIVLYDKIHESFSDLIDNPNIVFLSCHKNHSIDLGASLELKKHLTRVQPDIINFHLGFLTTYFLAFGFKRKKWHLIKTYHSIPGKDLNRINLILEKKYAIKNMLSFIGISNQISKTSKIIYPSCRVKTIYNAVLINGKVQTMSAKFDFIIVASLEPVKNHILLFSAFKRIVDLNKTCKLLVVGDGSLRSELERYVLSNHLEKNIVFAGSVSNVSPFLSQSRIFVLSSLREGLPISILEAMGHGLPIIAPFVGGIPDIIGESNGLLFESQNEEQLFNAMKKLSSDCSLYDKISKNNIKKIKDFSIEKCASKYIQEYNYCLRHNENEK